MHPYAITQPQRYAIDLINKELNMDVHPANKWEALKFIREYYAEAKQHLAMHTNTKQERSKITMALISCRTCAQCPNPGAGCTERRVCRGHQYHIPKPLTCPHAIHCQNASDTLECFGEYDDDEPCNKYLGITKEE